MKRRLAIASVLALTTVIGSQGLAAAQEVPPRQPVTIDVAKACGVVTLTFKNPNLDVTKTHAFRWNAVNGGVATAEGLRTGVVTIPPNKTVKENITFPEDEFDGVGAVTVAVVLGPDSDIQPKLDIFPVDTDCALPGTTPDTEEPDPETTTNPPPATTDPPPPPATTTDPPPPVTTDTPIPPLPVADDQDCDDFATQTDAQNHLNADTTDPDNLDSDNDLEACEAFFAPAQIPAPPVGGVETGDGSTA